MDVLALHQAGTLSAIASSGTAVTLEQLKEIKRFTSTVIFCFDSDSAGKMATERGIEIAQGADFIIKILRIPTAKDPADLIQAEGVTSWEKLLSEAEPYLDFVFRTAFSEADIETEEGRRSVQERVFPVLLKIFNPSEKDRWIKKFASLLGIQPNIAYEALSLFEKNQRKTFKIVPKNAQTESEAASRSPTTKIKGTFCISASLILAFRGSFLSFTSARMLADLSEFRTDWAYGINLSDTGRITAWKYTVALAHSMRARKTAPTRE